MSWIKKVSYEESSGRLRKLYDRIKGGNNYLDNILTIHGLRPHSLEGHMTLYKNVLHNRSNTLPKWLLELLGVYVSMLNKCAYCVEHHYQGMKDLIDDDDRSSSLRRALESNDFQSVLNAKERVLLDYANLLTLEPNSLSETNIQSLRAQGYDDGEILEVNQVCAYFSYANRTVLGLGVSTQGDILGLSPGDSDDSGNWAHDEAQH